MVFQIYSMGLEKYSYIAVNSSTQNEKMYEMIDGVRNLLETPIN